MHRFINIIISFLIFLTIILMHPIILFLLIKKLFNIRSISLISFDNSKLINEYSEDGFTSIKLSNSELNYLSLYNKVIRKMIFLNRFFFKRIFIDKKYYLYTNSNIVKHQLFFPNIENILKKRLNNLFEDILGKNYYITSFLWQRNMHFPENYSEELYSNFWHYDFKRQPNRWCRVMVYLNDQEEKESIHLFKLNTSKNAMKNELYGRYSEENLPELIKNEKYLSSPGPKGTIKIINTADLLHRAGHLKKGKTRDVFFIIMQSKYKWNDNPKFLLPPENKMVNLT